MSFLDQETAKIDALVEEQRRLIDLLKEKRQAVISRAVTKGLEPATPMKDSGTVWIGSIPSSWDCVPIKFAAAVESGHTPDKKVESYWGGSIPWVSLNDTGFLKDHDYIRDTAFTVTEEGIRNSSARVLPSGAVCFSRDATIGRCAITEVPMAVSQHFIAWICSERLNPEYLLRVCQAMQQELDRFTTGATIKTIGLDHVRALRTPLPPIREQARIVSSIDEQLQELDRAMRATDTSLLLLRERRSALISAAVTGKIDVRSYKPQPSAVAEEMYEPA